MAFANKRQIAASVAVSALLAVSMITIALTYFPSKEAGPSAATQYSSSGAIDTQSTTASPAITIQSSTILGSTTQSSTISGTTTLVYLDPSNCHGNCTLDIPWPTYNSLASLTAASSYIGVANVTSVSTTDVDGVPVFLYNITVVQNVIENKYVSPGSIWTVAQIGGTVNGTSMSIQGYPSLVIGSTYVFFVNYAGFLAEYYGLNLMTVGGPQGLFYIHDGQVFSLDNMYPQADAWLPVKAAGVPLGQFIQEVQSAATTTTSDSTTTTSTITSSTLGPG
jgi:hypothetical protein